MRPLIPNPGDRLSSRWVAKDRAAVLSEWTDRDMLIGGHVYPAGTITIADALDHAARAAALAKLGGDAHPVAKPPEFPPGFDKPHSPSGGRVA